MARPGLTRHRKFLRLARMIGGRALAIGSLELVWEVAYENGDPIIGDALSVEAAADWNGKPGVLASALAECGFLDGTPDEYTVHDFWTHAPAYVRKRRKRELDRHEAAQSLSGDQSVTSQCPPNGPRSEPNGSTPCTLHPAPCTREKSIVKRAARAKGNAAPSLPWEDFSSMTDEALWARRIELAKQCGGDERLRARFIACSHECLKRSGQAGSGGEA